MRRLDLLVAALTAVLLGLGAARVCRAAEQPAAVQPATAQPAEGPGAIAAIQQAAEPSAVISAFSKALAAGEDQLAAYTAYVHRMAQLGLPQAAFSQAQTVVAMNPSDGVSWAAIAFTRAGEGKADEALSTLAKAVSLAGKDLFVVKTAGQLLAWYDTTPGLTVSDQTGKAIEDIRAGLADNETFAKAYTATIDASQLYLPAGGEQAVTATPTQQQAQGEPYVPAAPAESRPSAAYTQPLVAPYYYYPYSYLHGEYYSPFVWWPGYTPVYVTHGRRHHMIKEHHERYSGRGDHRTFYSPVFIHGGRTSAIPSVGGSRSAFIHGGKITVLPTFGRPERARPGMSGAIIHGRRH